MQFSQNFRCKNYVKKTPVGLALGSTLMLSAAANAQLAINQDKFLGNIIANNVPADFSNYWNQVTPENSGKWGSLESTRDVMNWGNLDTAYQFAQANGYLFKQHTFVWGSQEPGWIGSLSQAEQRAEVEEFMQLYCQRYPATDFIDVVNEPLHAPASYRAALGGEGASGWDWVIWSFEKARQYCPDAKLLINDYGIINDGNALNQYKQIISLLQARGLIDGVGIQVHAFNMDNLAASTIKNNLDSLAQTGLPIYPSELDLRGDDQVQRDRYAEKFPLLWEHPAVAGITLWGYREGATWLSGTHLISSDGSERPSMEWLKNYFGGQNSSSSASSISSRSSSALSSSVSSSVTTSSLSSSSSSSVNSGVYACNWYGSMHPVCVTTATGWGWEDNRSCVAAATCRAQPAPFGIVGASSSTSASASSASRSASSAVSSSSIASSSAVSQSSSASSVAAAGNCQYILTNQWGTGFTAMIRITNSGSVTLNNWSVSWAYADARRVTSAWNANVTGNNPYRADSLGWNATIQPGQAVEFGIQGTTSSAAVGVPQLTGSVCN